MPLSTDDVTCLIVEDDRFKLDSIRVYLQEVFQGRAIISECYALSSAVSKLGECHFDVVIIDMSIHSHDPQVGAGSPLPLPNGGLDVLFEINYLDYKSVCIILTQYTDIDIEGVPVPVELAAAEIESKFGIKIAGCVQYSENELRWKSEVGRVLEGL